MRAMFGRAAFRADKATGPLPSLELGSTLLAPDQHSGRFAHHSPLSGTIKHSNSPNTLFQCHEKSA